MMIEKFREILSLKNIYAVMKIIILIIAVYSIFQFVFGIKAKFDGMITSQQVQEIMDAKNREYLQITENIVRANTEVNSKLLKEEIGKLDEKITNKIKESDEKIKQIGNIVSKQKQTATLNKPSNMSYEGKKDYNDYEFIKIYSSEKDGFPVAWVMFYPNREKDKQWKYGTYPLEYNTQIIQTEQKSGTTNNYVKAWVENNQMTETKGRQFPINITSAEFVQKPLTEKSFMWVPSLDGGIIVGGVAVKSDNIQAGVMINLSLWGYGKTKKDLDWRFVSFGVGGNDSSFWGQVSPIVYNIGNHIPLMSNLWIGPYFMVDKNSNPGGGLGVSVRF